jgi:hypothetical protein
MLTESPALNKTISGTRAGREPIFLKSIQHHQNNSFDEFRERRYARANHEDAAL